MTPTKKFGDPCITDWENLNHSTACSHIASVLYFTCVGRKRTLLSELIWPHKPRQTAQCHFIVEGRQFAGTVFCGFYSHRCRLPSRGRVEQHVTEGRLRDPVHELTLYRLSYIVSAQTSRTSSIRRSFGVSLVSLFMLSCLGFLWRVTKNSGQFKDLFDTKKKKRKYFSKDKRRL